jgi:hypothetical protein
MATTGDSSAPIASSTGGSQPLGTTTSALLPATGVLLPPTQPPTLASIADSLARLTSAFNGMQLQMSTMNHQLSVQGAHLTAMDGQQGYPQFGLPGFGGVPHLPATLAPVITKVSTTAEDSSASAFPSLPLSSTVPQGQHSALAPPPMGVPITHIRFPHSPSPIPTVGSVTQSLSQPASAHMAPPQPAWESVVGPKYHKISFETYDGKEDLLGWLNNCEQFFRGQLTREVVKVWMASYHLKGVAK